MEDIVANFEPKEVKFGGTAKSGEYNTMNKEISQDMALLFKQLTQNNKKVDDIYDILSIENEYLNQVRDEIKEALSILEESNGEIYTNFYQTNKIHFGDKLDGVNEIPTEKRAFIKNDYNTVTLPVVNMISKIYHSNLDGSIFVPEELNMGAELYYNGNPDNTLDYVELQEDSLKSAVNTSPRDLYKIAIDKNNLESAEQTDVNSVSLTINVRIPNSINTNTNANYISINPFPSNSLEISSMRYKSKYNGHWIDVNQFQVKNSENTIISLSDDTEIYEFEVTMTQNNLITHENNEKYVLGLQNIGIYSTDYADSGSFFVKVTPQTRPDEIEEVKPILNNISDGETNLLDDAVETEVYLVNSFTKTLDKYSMGTEVLNNYMKDFYIRVTLNKVGNLSTPVLKGLVTDIKT